ncbi:universal stress protein [Haloarculaceae archaeon H-GB2-1]|nr:universal stress protein [Haloarculaceae archaeon H-GB1-1]MEA5406607.1 universal stress protein [Haloarculaceae archaeon H-GB2-1]
MSDTVLVAYDGGVPSRNALAFAAERAGRTGDELHVYHILEDEKDAAAIRADVESLLAETAPDVDAEIVFEERDQPSDSTNVSLAKRLLDRIDRYNYAMVVLGNEEHSALEELTLPSLTKAVLETRSIPVLLVP